MNNSLIIVLVSFAVIQTALTENIENQNGTNNYDPEKVKYQ